LVPFLSGDFSSLLLPVPDVAVKLFLRVLGSVDHAAPANHLSVGRVFKLRTFKKLEDGHVHFDVSFVKGIEKGASGKFSFVKSDIGKAHVFGAGSVFQA